MKRYIKQILIVILALCTFLCVPSTVYASTESVTPDTAYIISTGLGAQYSKNPYYSSFGTYQKFVFYELNCNLNYPISKGNILIFDIKLNQDVYFDISSCAGAIYGSTDIENVSTFIDDVSYSNRTISLTFIVNDDFNAKDFRFSISSQSSDFSYSCSDNTPFTIDISSIECTKTTETQSLLNRLKGWFNSLFQWLKDIRDNATEGFANIGKWFENLGNSIKSWFSELTDNISSFFTELKNNLTEWFKNVGNWFSELGNSIGEFFTNIWNNISDSISNITESVSNWWQGIVDWFDSLFKVPEGYFDEYMERWNNWMYEHLGFVYQAIGFVSDFIDMLYNGIKNGKMNSVVTFPTIVLPFNNVTLVESFTFDLDSYIKGNSTFNLLYRMMQTMMTGIMVIALINYSQKFFNNLIGTKEE